MLQNSAHREDGFSAVAKLDVASLSPESFWADHIAARKPALIRGHPSDMAWRASSLWTDDYLIRRAGGAEVLVEVRGGPLESYGRGVKRRMRFGQFVAARESGLYLTAQQVSVAPDGHPQLLAEPLMSLVRAGASKSGRGGRGRPGGRANDDDDSDDSDGGVGGGPSSSSPCSADFPASLELAGHLVPQSLNMWMGAAPEGSSSGLHHDFHDNIYVLLRGTKRFRLYPPATAPTMYTNGKLVRMYDNGRIVYEGQGDVLADGTDAADVAKWRRRTEAEAAVAAAEAAVERGEAGARARLDECEAALEAALEAELSDALLEREDEGMEEEDMDDEEEEDEDGFEGLGREDGDDEDEDGSSDDEEEEGNGRGGKGKSPKGKGTGGKGSKGRSTGGKEAAAEEEGGLIVDPDTPPSFSRVPLGDPRVGDAQLAAEFPRFPGRGAAVEVTVQAGEMLYLPAGWFHEVTSYGSAGGPDGGHLAFNYWFHPPDNLDPSRHGFKAPYTSDYWPALWRARVAEGLPGALEPGLGAQPPPLSKTAEADADGGGGGGSSAAVLGKRSRGRAVSGSAGGGLPAASEAADGGCGDGGRGERPSHRVRLSSAEGGAADGLQQQQRQQQQEKEAVGLSPGDGDSDLDPPRRQRPAAAARALMAKLAAAESAAGSDGAGGGGEGGGAAVELTEEDYQLLMLMEAARQRSAAVGAFRAFFEKQMRMRRLHQMRARLPPGRRHHPVIAVGPEARAWRPPPPPPGQQQKREQQREGKQQQRQREKKENMEQQQPKQQQKRQKPARRR
ncbi:hypothetical protein PLESTB_001789000 [Pleodorina starrii]|uniref:JmjC domain-containing protein n=1 Tax=Pleodorina starrii TaxID=330485 RepID=A0A9W6C0K7_9CHLO|nr:hypothetical protein PLESTM_001759500 [Pleodorina starrii]GLC61667.1 hypothetical protein PLESTB_001789000 [Pleodorina starrii]GLC76512.1 hypothetical protein PLESTF_001791000 [Pleodorina starrii]